MSCGRRQCKRTLRTAPLYCRCGVEFCSEPCFVSEWHAEHQTTCPYAADILSDISERKAKSERSGTALLVATALSRAPPSRPTPSVQGESLGSTEASSPASKSPLASSSTGSASGINGASPTSQSALRSEAQHPSTASASPTFRRFRFEDFTSVGDNIGSGSYGQVSKVVHKVTGEVFAMKAILKQKVVEHHMNEYLIREVKTQMRIQHPNVLRLHYYFEDAQNVYLLLEFADGGSLFSVLRRRGKLPEPEAARVFVDVAGALHHLHRRGIVHRDLKPENILMCAASAPSAPSAPSLAGASSGFGTFSGPGSGSGSARSAGVAKLADFGWCAELSRLGAQRQTFCGTWDYLSPEMIQSEPHDHTVDVWALGVLLYETLTGSPPFAASSQVKAMNRITSVDLHIPEGISPLAADLIGKLIVRERQNRLSLPEAVLHPWVRCYVDSTWVDTAPSPTKVAIDFSGTQNQGRIPLVPQGPSTGELLAGRTPMMKGGDAALVMDTRPDAAAPGAPVSQDRHEGGLAAFANLGRPEVSDPDVTLAVGSKRPPLPADPPVPGAFGRGAGAGLNIESPQSGRPLAGWPSPAASALQEMAGAQPSTPPRHPDRQGVGDSPWSGGASAPTTPAAPAAFHSPASGFAQDEGLSKPSTMPWGAPAASEAPKRAAAAEASFAGVQRIGAPVTVAPCEPLTPPAPPAPPAFAGAPLTLSPSQPVPYEQAVQRQLQGVLGKSSPLGSAFDCQSDLTSLVQRQPGQSAAMLRPPASASVSPDLTQTLSKVRQWMQRATGDLDRTSPLGGLGSPGLGFGEGPSPGLTPEGKGNSRDGREDFSVFPPRSRSGDDVPQTVPRSVAVGSTAGCAVPTPLPKRLSRRESDTAPSDSPLSSGGEVWWPGRLGTERLAGPGGCGGLAGPSWSGGSPTTAHEHLGDTSGSVFSTEQLDASVFLSRHDFGVRAEDANPGLLGKGWGPSARAAA